jgi:chromosome segregation ATPase
MSPDSALGQLAQRVARLEQRVDDLAQRAVERLADLAEAVRSARADARQDYEAFGPMLVEHAEIRGDVRHLGEVVSRLERRFAEFERRWDERERREVEQGHHEAEERGRKVREERRDRWARWAFAVTLPLMLVSTTVSLLVAIL